MELDGTHQTECKCHLHNQVKEGENSWRGESSQRGGRKCQGQGRVEEEEERSERKSGMGEGGGEERGSRRE